MKAIAWFNEIDKDSLALVGGKGANLGEMTKAGFPVPEGYVVTADAYYYFLRESNLDDKMSSMIRGIDVNDSKGLQSVAKQIKDEMLQAPMPENVKTAIQDAYLKLSGGTTTVPVAVRSSATAEDLPGASFAGQQATFLNIKGALDVVDAVRRCWASLFEPRAIFYREDKGFDHMSVGIAVPVQRMVQADVSGIMFSVDPITNDRDKVIIEAGFGLGEAIVSGSVTPDRYIVDKKTFEILDKEINEQEFKFVRKQEIVSSTEEITPVADQPVAVEEKPQLADLPEIVKPDEVELAPVAEELPAAEAVADPVEPVAVAQDLAAVSEEPQAPVSEPEAPVAVEAEPQAAEAPVEPPLQPVEEVKPVEPPVAPAPSPVTPQEPGQTIEDILNSVQGTGDTVSTEPVDAEPAPDPVVAENTPEPVASEEPVLEAPINVEQPVEPEPAADKPEGLPSLSPLPGVIKQTSAAVDGSPPPVAPAIAPNPEGGDAFVISEDELEQDIQAIRNAFTGQADDPDQMPPLQVADDTTQSNTMVDTIFGSNVSFTFSGDLAASVASGSADDNNPNEEILLGADEKGLQKMTDEQIVDLAKLGAKVEEHYQYPQDMEWAIENGQIYLVQSRPVTTLGDEPAESEGGPAASSGAEKQAQAVEAAKQIDEMADGAPTIILKGGGASIGAAAGPVKNIADASEIDKVLEGDVLVTRMTTPDFVPAMKRAAAIVTDTGGRTCHAAIVSRELGIPCVVGTKEATATLKNGQIITVNGTHGVVYEGEILTPKVEVKKTLTEGQASLYEAPITGTKVYVNLAEADLAPATAARAVDGVGLLRAEFMILAIGEHPRKMIEEGRQEEFVNKLAAGLRKFMEPFYPRPVVYRATDFKTNEYRGLDGGDKYEPEESNPMIGYRGCFRYLNDPEVFKLEIEAIKKVREEYDNLHVMIPFVRTIPELRAVKKLMADNGLEASKDFKLWMMVEVPSTVFLMEEFCKEGIDGVSIGTNDLTQLILGVDRDSEMVAPVFDERDPAVLLALKKIVKTCQQYGVTCSICGQAPSVYPEITEKLVEWEITSVSVNPDMIEQTRRLIASVERRMLMHKITDVDRKEEEELAILRK